MAPEVDTRLSSSKPSSAPNGPSDGVPIKRKVLKRVRKNREKSGEGSSGEGTTAQDATGPTISLGASVMSTLTSSPVYLAFVLLRFLLIFVTPGSLEGIEYDEGVDSLAAALLPGISSGGQDPQLILPPSGMGDVNRTRSIVGAFATSGIPYMGVNLFCNKVVDVCTPGLIGYLAIYVPRVWMFFLSLLTDVFFARTFAVYEGTNASSGLTMYASTWTTLLCMTRNTNYALETMCTTALAAACFGWRPNIARPVLWISAWALALAVFLRPVLAFLICIPGIYLTSLWGKSGIDPLRYVRAFLEGFAIFGFWSSIFVAVDSVYFGTFKLRFGDTVMDSFDMFVDYATKGLPFSYKGSLVYTPINALKSIATKQFLSEIRLHTSPGQMFLSLPAALGPLFIVLMRESFEGLKVLLKELMTELKQVANSKKPKKRKTKKAGMTKEIEDEIYVYFDTLQTSFLLGLTLEVMQDHPRLGTISVMFILPLCMICVAGTLFGPNSSSRFRYLHLLFTAAMVFFYGFCNQSGVPKVLLKAGAGGIDSIPQNADLVVYRGVIGHRAALGANLKNISVHDGGESKLKLMETLRELKASEGYNEERLLVLAAATVPMKDTEFELVETVALGHMSIFDLPNNVDDAMQKASLMMYRFVGDENEAIINDDEEAAEKEEEEREEKMRGKRKRSSSKEEL